MNRRTSIKIIAAASFSLISGGLAAKKKKNNKKGGSKKGKNNKKGGGRKNNNKKNEPKVMSLSGEITVSEDGITKTYQIKSGKVYSFSRTLVDKIGYYLGQTVSLRCKVTENRIIAIDSVSGKKKS